MGWEGERPEAIADPRMMSMGSEMQGHYKLTSPLILTDYVEIRLPAAMGSEAEQ
jgi:hypothetical protein